MNTTREHKKAVNLTPTSARWSEYTQEMGKKQQSKTETGGCKGNKKVLG